MEPVENRVRVAVVGVGHWGRNLVRNFHALGALDGVCESDSARLDSALASYPGLKKFTSYEDLLFDPAIQAVVIATPAEMHGGMALAALEAGKDVFVEKPLCLHRQEGDCLVETAAKNGRILMVGHLLRYHPAVLKIQELLAAGTLGAIEYIYSNRLSMGKVRQEENALWSFAPHDISVILALAGQSPIQVSATGGAYLQPNIADITVSHLLFSNGARAHIFVSWLHPYKEQRLVVIGSKQMIVFEDTHPDPARKLALFDKRVQWDNGRMQLGGTQGAPVPVSSEEPLRRECQHFLDSVKSRRAPATPGEEGVAVLQVLECCQRSLQMNGDPVQVQTSVSQRVTKL
jgi:UDP-2-acetamido-3-amino-2,3-dideoxy-glucuronate N-acetyltransferase